MVGKDEGKQIASSANVVTQDWDAAWDSEEELMPKGSNRASLEEERKAVEVSATHVPHVQLDDDDEESADAWGWGDEDVVDEPAPENVAGQPSHGNPTNPHSQPVSQTREITLSETYYHSSMPRPVFKTVADIFNDGARLAGPEYIFLCSLS